MATTRRQSVRAGESPAASVGDIAVLSLDRVSRAYGSVVALAPLTLHLGRGSVCVVQGANGSGKTTLLRLAAGILVPTTGRRHAKGRSLYLRSGDGVRHAQSARQAVRFATALTGASCEVQAVLDAVELTDLADVAAATLSAGQRARATLAVAAACRPDIACLDEPTAHLDRQGHAVAAHIVRELAARGAAVLVATHDDGFLSAVADARVDLRRGFAEVVA